MRISDWSSDVCSSDVSVDISAKGATLRATGSPLVFDGFLTLYQEDRDDPPEDDRGERRLPKLEQGERLAREAILPEQHFPQPPPRYSEASLVQKLEELGNGRPST